MVSNTEKKHRLQGLDIARFFAFVGMVVVNFNIVITNHQPADGLMADMIELLQGKAAASFVVLAGVGLALQTKHKGPGAASWTTLKRALFLLAVGLINALVFEADILHFYGVYFIFSLILFRLSSKTLLIFAIGLPWIFVIAITLWDYETGWNWQTLHYEGFWSPTGFVRHIFYNGWHPVLPWIAFIAFGMWLAEFDLGSQTVAGTLFVLGLSALIAITLFSIWLGHLLDPQNEWAILAETGPIPPMPLFLYTGMATASMVIGACSWAMDRFKHNVLLTGFAMTGRHALTLYIAHIWLAMGMLEGFGMLDNQSTGAAVFAALMFCVLAVVFSMLWSKQFKVGPIEALMRRLT